MKPHACDSGARPTTALIRIRFTCDLVEKLDRLAQSLARTVPRAALIRALVLLHMGGEGAPQTLEDALAADPVRRRVRVAAARARVIETEERRR